MSAPVVSGTVALMIQANPSLTPNQVKAILQYTAEIHPDHDWLTEGAGFLNAKGAVDLARYFGGNLSVYPSSSAWGRRVIWGNKLVAGGRLLPGMNAWPRSVVWGSSTSTSGDPIELGMTCAANGCDDNGGATWTLAVFRNVVWGPMCGGSDCSSTWSVDLFGAADGDTVVWGTGDTGDTVVWGTTDADTVVWGTADGDTVVWGTGEGDTVVWGTTCSDPSCVPVIWKQ
jgi:hypothetical protein